MKVIDLQENLKLLPIFSKEAKGFALAYSGLVDYGNLGRLKGQYDELLEPSDASVLPIGRPDHLRGIAEWRLWRGFVKVLVHYYDDHGWEIFMVGGEDEAGDGSVLEGLSGIELIAAVRGFFLALVVEREYAAATKSCLDVPDSEECETDPDGE